MTGANKNYHKKATLRIQVALVGALATVAGIRQMLDQQGTTQALATVAAGQGKRTPFPKFEVHVINGDFPRAYSCAVADVDGDGRLDVIAQGQQVAWFRNPTWTRYPISATVTRANVYIAPHDITGDGLPELVLAHDFSLSNSTEGGSVSWLERRGDLNHEWTLHPIDAEPTAHRVFWANLDGQGRKELLVIPILGPGAKAPDYNQASVRLLAYFLPDHPRRDRWAKQLIDNSLHLSHTVRVVDFDADARDEILMVSFEGVFLFDSLGTGPEMKWTKRKLGSGYQAEPAPRRGASEIGLGRLPNGGRYLATIEPWHGHQVVVYTPPASDKATGLWTRHVIDDRLNSGHALTVADVDGDGAEEIFAGIRGAGSSFYGYDPLDGGGKRWTRYVLDEGGMAAQGCLAADLDGDNDLDLVAVGGSTNNVKWYENRGGADGEKG